MHNAVLTTIVVASLLGAAAMSVVQAAEAPQSQSTDDAGPLSEGSRATIGNVEIAPVNTGFIPVQEIQRPARESYYGQGFESRGIDSEELPRGGPVFGSGRTRE